MEEDRKITGDDLRKAFKEAVQHVHDLQAELALMSPEDRRANEVFYHNRLDEIECAIMYSDVLGNFVNGYIFGKILDDRYYPNYYDPARICVLLIYKKYWDGLQVIKKEIEGIIYRVMGNSPSAFGDGWCPDITMLSVAELEETKFLDKIFPHYIRIK